MFLFSSGKQVPVGFLLLGISTPEQYKGFPILPPSLDILTRSPALLLPEVPHSSLGPHTEYGLSKVPTAHHCHTGGGRSLQPLMGGEGGSQRQREEDTDCTMSQARVCLT